MSILVIIPEQNLRGFIHPAIDLATGAIIELEAEPVPVQLELFGAGVDGSGRIGEPLPATL